VESDIPKEWVPKRIATGVGVRFRTDPTERGSLMKVKDLAGKIPEKRQNGPEERSGNSRMINTFGGQEGRKTF